MVAEIEYRKDGSIKRIRFGNRWQPITWPQPLTPWWQPQTIPSAPYTPTYTYRINSHGVISGTAGA